MAKYSDKIAWGDCQRKEHHYALWNMYCLITEEVVHDAVQRISKYILINHPNSAKKVMSNSWTKLR